MNALPSLLMMLSSNWTRGLVGAGILSILVWSFLPLVPALAGTLPRICAILAIFALFAVATYLIEHRRRRRRSTVDRAITARGDDEQDGAAGAAEVAALRTRLRDAIAILHKRGVKRLYDLPWYMLIGPPGAGKTTALTQSGLHFPLSETEPDALRGVGGTRLCDWWFSEEAVLIDTAGRYTTQDSSKAVDKAGWLGFLDLLRRARPRQPLNGVIVVIALPELVEATPAQRDAHARSIRLRIGELYERLKVRLPVYLVVSKMDRLAGFDAFFDDLDSVARTQVWGTTFALEQGQESFVEEFRLLTRRIEDRLIDRLQAERGYDRRAIASGFPLQLASIEQTLADFLSVTFSGSRVDPAPFLRGVYLTSATQTGAPLDRLSGMLARSFGIDQKRAPSLRPAVGRSYFIGRMMRDVILGETPLVSITPRRFRRRKIVRLASLGLVCGVTLTGLGLIWFADTNGRLAIQRKQDAFAEYGRAAAAIPPGLIAADDDLPQVDAVLGQAAALRATQDQTVGRLIGLSTRGKLIDAGRIAYLDALQHLLYPRLLRRLEQQIHDHLEDPDTLYDATRVYLMLGGLGPHDPAIIEQWIEADWAWRFRGALNEALRRQLAVHLAALLAAPLPTRELPLDGGLVEQARTRFAHVTPARRIYDRLRAVHGDIETIGWSPEMALGSASATTFVRLGGEPLSDGIPAFYTGAGFSTIMRDDLPPAARLVADESWVVGRSPDIDTDGPAVGALEREVAQLWADDARQHWDGLLSDLLLRPFRDRRQTEDTLYLLSSPQSPLRDMLTSIVRAIKIAPLAASDPIAPVAEVWNARYRPLYALLGMQAQPPADPVASRNGGSPAVPFDAIVKLIEQLDGELATGNAIPAALPQIALQTADPAQRLLAEAARQPPPIAGWLRQIAQSGNNTLGEVARSSATGEYNKPSGPSLACRNLVQNHYPFDAQASQDASLADFAHVFGPGGVMDGFFQLSVAPYADTGSHPWRAHPAGGVASPFTDKQLVPFEQAARIRDAFFPAGSMPVMYLTLQLSAPTGTTLALGGITVKSGQPSSVIWPGADGLSPAMLQKVAAGKTTVQDQERGPWALFRLLREAPAPAQNGSAHIYDLTADSATSLSVDAGNGRDPFRANLLAGYSCPVVP